MIVTEVSEEVQATDGPVMVILDGDHSEKHVFRELEIYSRFVTLGSYLLSQDGPFTRIDKRLGAWSGSHVVRAQAANTDTSRHAVSFEPG